MDKRTKAVNQAGVRHRGQNGEEACRSEDTVLYAVDLFEDDTDTCSDASLECNVSSSTLSDEFYDRVVSNRAARTDPDHNEQHLGLWFSLDRTGASDHGTLPALDSDDETLSDTSSSATEDEDATDVMSTNDEPFGSQNPAYPSNSTDAVEYHRLDSFRLGLNYLAQPGDCAGTNAPSLERFINAQDDPWSVYSADSLLFSDGYESLALDGATAPSEVADTARDALKH